MAFSVRKIKDTIRRVEEIGAAGGDVREDRPPATIEVHWLKITSTTKTAERYPAIRYDRDANARTFTAAETCWLDTPNDDTLVLDTFYPCKLAGVREADSLVIYDLVLSSSTGFRYRYICGPSGSGESGNCCDDPREDLTATVTAKVGVFTTLPDTFDMEDNGSGGWITTTQLTSNGITQYWSINCNFDAGLGIIPVLSFPNDGEGEVHEELPDEGYTCNPLTVVYTVNYQASSCTITIVG